MIRPLRLALLASLAVPLVSGDGFAGASSPQPDLVQPTSVTVRADLVATMPFVDGPTVNFGLFGPNLASPVSIKNKLYLIDQNDGIYRVNGKNRVQRIFDVADAPDGLSLDNRHSILNISKGRRANSLYVMFQSGTPPTDVEINSLPDPLSERVCCSTSTSDGLQPIDDLYRIGPIPEFFGPQNPTRTEYQVLYEYKLAGNKLVKPHAILAFETQSDPAHNGGGMVTLDDGRVLFATGDALPSGADGRTAAQDDNEIVGKLIVVDPVDGSFAIAGKGVRNVQRLQVSDIDDTEYLAFADIGGVTAEEVNVVPVADLLDTSQIENFGWGRNPDGLAREGTFHLEDGIVWFPGDPGATGIAPSPESGFIQPHAQYGRNDASGGFAVSGPVVSDASLDSLTMIFSDLASGILYGTTGPVDDVASTVFRVNLIDADGAVIASFRDLAGGRADPRLFTFPDGTAGVLLEATGDLYRLTEI